MSEQEKQAQPTPPIAEKGALWRRLSPRHWLLIVVGSSVITHLVLLTAWRGSPSSQPEPGSAEWSLGHYRFVNHKSEPGKENVQQAEFDLHLHLLPGADHAARAALEARKYRVQQDVEELLRQAHAGDFDDPTLTELKRQLQEKINATLEMRAIAEVIITDLRLEGIAPTAPAPELADRPRLSPRPEFVPDTAVVSPAAAQPRG